MKIVFNTNSYIGGGETFVFEFLRLNLEYKIVCAKNSWLWSVLDGDRVLYYHKPSKFNLFGKLNQMLLKRLLKLKGLKVTQVLFLNFQDFLTYRNLFSEDVIIDYYCLHPYDFFYRSAKNNLSLFLETITKSRAPIFGKRALVNYSLINDFVNGTLFFMDEINLQLHKGQIFVKTKVLALPCIEDKGFLVNKKPGKKILWIGRLVDFKMTSLNSIISFVDENPTYTLTVVGDGTFSNRVINYKNSERITFIGKVDYSELEEVIKNHDIGFGMGVSSVLMASYSLPTIVGVTDYPNWNVNSKNKCFGQIYELGYGDFGSGVYQSNPLLKDISEILDFIDKNYMLSSKLSHRKSLEFSFKNLENFANKVGELN